MTVTPVLEEALPTHTKIVVSPTPTTTVTPAASATETPEPTAETMKVVTEENGWVTYRNEVVGYEISAPTSYQIKGTLPEVGWMRHGLLGPAVPDEEINRLLSKYYGGSLWVWLSNTGANSLEEPPVINIIAYDILVNDLGGWVGQPGGADYQYTSRQETLNIDWQSYPVKITVEFKGQSTGGGIHGFVPGEGWN